MCCCLLQARSIGRTRMLFTVLGSIELSRSPAVEAFWRKAFRIAFELPKLVFATVVF